MKSGSTIIQVFLHYSKSQRIGIVLLFLIIISLQTVYFCVDFDYDDTHEAAKTNWLAHQSDIDRLKSEKKNYKPTIYPFNPNFITDFKGYRLGMSVEEIDRLLAFRKQNKYVNSAEEFQQVTKVSDSLLNAISPYFKFPDWVKNRKQYANGYKPFNYPKKDKIPVLDINEASKEELIRIYGIGDALSDRILKQKELFGGFVSMEQLQDVWGLSPEVIENLNKYFRVNQLPKVKKIAINDASVKELSQFPYFRYALAKEIVTYRSMNGDVKIEDLPNIKGFPVEKIKIIALYLEF